MKKHLLIGTFGADDTVPDISQAGESPTLFPLIIGEATLNFGLSRVLQDLFSHGNYPTEIGLDLMILAAHVYAADTRISRRTESQDSWTRELRLVVPVSDPSRWERVAGTLKTLLNFLTGDLWSVGFRERPNSSKVIIPVKPDGSPNFNYNKLQLFSGGLDSLIRTIDNLEQGESPFLISHAGDGATSDAQSECLSILKEQYKDKAFDRLRLWMNIPSGTFEDIGIENTTRGRSFLFFSLGILAGTGMSSPFTLEAPENGLIALNVPLDNLRLGSLSTHTTHPYYIEQWNKLLNEIGISGKIVNPYWNKTKGEMVSECNNPSILQQTLPHSMSCSSPSKARWQGNSTEHCGYCLPCLIRRASVFSRSGITDNTVYTIPDLSARELNSMQAEGHQIRSFQVAARRLVNTRRIANVLIHKSGPLPYDSTTLLSLANVYLRGMQEIGNMLRNVVTKPL